MGRNTQKKNSNRISSSLGSFEKEQSGLSGSNGEILGNFLDVYGGLLFNDFISLLKECSIWHIFISLYNLERWVWVV